MSARLRLQPPHGCKMEAGSLPHSAGWRPALSGAVRAAGPALSPRGGGCGAAGMAGRAQQPPAVPQPPGGGHHHHPYPYPCPYPHPVAAEGEGPEEEAEAFELRPRGREKVRRSASRDRPDDIVLLARDIQEGDTLNAIALQFCCSVSGCPGSSGRISRAGGILRSQPVLARPAAAEPVPKRHVLPRPEHQGKRERGSGLQAESTICTGRWHKCCVLQPFILLWLS